MKTGSASNLWIAAGGASASRPALALLWLSLLAAPACSQAPTIPLSVGEHQVQAEVASSGESRQLGLMHRRQMQVHRGMLFVFPQTAQHCMWMRNTYLPLSVAFIDEAGKIINIADMQPESETNHCAARPAKFALEMNAGWFRQRGIAAGQLVGGVERAPAPQ